MTQENNFNEGGEDFDVRIEGADIDAYSLQVGGTDKVGVGTNGKN